MNKIDTLYLIATKLYIDSLKEEDDWGIMLAVSVINYIKQKKSEAAN